MNKLQEWLRHFSRRYRERSIQNMISLSFTAVALVGMLFLAGSLYLRFFGFTQTIIRDNHRRVIEQVNVNLDGYLRNMMRISDTMYFRVIKNADFSTDSIDRQMNLLYEVNRDSLISIALFNSGGGLVTGAPLSALKERARPELEEWFITARAKIENLHFSGPHVQNLFADPDFRYRWVISLSRAVELTSHGSIQSGVLLVDMNFSGIEQALKNVRPSENGYVYLIDREGGIIYHPRQQLIYSGLFQENPADAAAYEDGTHIEKFSGERRIITVKTVGYTGWKIVGVSPMSDMTSGYAHISMFALFILLFLIFLMVYANLYVSSRIADPIKSLENSVKELEGGNWEAPIYIGGSYEIRHLGSAIRSLVAQMRRLMDDIVQEQESKRRSELDALQSQINPHFLYNTLDSIVWMVENERYPEAISMVTSLARLFRISLSKGKNIISVSDELEHARNYMTIQKMRYKNKFEVTFDAQPETLGLATIKLIIQPLLENAIYHGMEFMDGDGEIRVSSRLAGGVLLIDVADNGIGIPGDICAALLTDTKRTRSKGSGIGLRNVHERIRLYFGEEYGLTILSEPDEGTTVRIRLPISPYEQEGR